MTDTKRDEDLVEIIARAMVVSNPPPTSTVWRGYLPQARAALAALQASGLLLTAAPSPPAERGVVVRDGVLGQGWKCPNCGCAHGPQMQTCPVDNRTLGEKIRSANNG